MKTFILSLAFVGVISFSVFAQPAYAFSTGDKVQTTAKLTVRATPSGRRLGAQNLGATGTLIGAPVVSKGSTWLNINYDTGLDGWSAQDYVTDLTAPAPAPVPAPVPAPAPAPAPTPSGSYQVYAGCQAPATTYANTIYVDPAAGSDTGDGTQAHPYKTLATVLSQNKLATDTHAILLPGDHGVIFADSYSNIPLSNATSGWVWLDFQPGATAQYMDIRAMNRWLITNATVTGAPAGLALVHIGYGSTNMVVTDSQIYTARDSSGWSVDQWINGANSGIVGDAVSCISLLRNHITNVRFGITVSTRAFSPDPAANSVKALIQDNVTNNFSADGMRPIGSDITIYHNGIYNSYVSVPAGDDNHDDAIQGFANYGAVYSNLVIDHNWVQESTAGPNRPLYSSLQGISSFDGEYTNSRVTYNVVLVSAPHGITWYGVRNFVIDHNTIANITNNGNPTWISMLYGDSSDTISNNTASSFSGDAAATVKLVNNVATADPAIAFTTFDPVNNQYNLAPKPGGPIAGLNVGAQGTAPVAISPAHHTPASAQLAATAKKQSMTETLLASVLIAVQQSSAWFAGVFQWFVHLFVH